MPDCPGAFLGSLGCCCLGRGVEETSVDEQCPNVAACFKLTFELNGLVGFGR